jgi:simple sugar transport system permease protein
LRQSVNWLSERSGVLNLGVEGMMVMGPLPVCGGVSYGINAHGRGAAILAGVGMSLLFGFLTLTLVANQVAAGLALTLLGLWSFRFDWRILRGSARPQDANAFRY